MTLLGKTMLNLDGTVRVLSPELDPVQLIRDYMIEVMQKRVGAQLSPGRVFAWALDVKHLVESSPRRTEMILNKLANDQLTVRLDLAHLDEMERTVRKAANRLSLGMVASALIIAGGQVYAARRRDSRND
jgi:ubiquinone biosynthesis protein